MSGTQVRAQGVVENANIDHFFTYEEVTALAPTNATEKYVELSWSYTKLFIYSDSAILISWSAGTGDVCGSNSQIIPAGVPVQMNVPWGLVIKPSVSSVYFHCKKVSSGTADVRIAKGQDMFNTVVSYLYVGKSAQTQTFTDETSVTLTHNLGYYPIIQLMDGSSKIIDGEITHTNTSETVISFAVSQSGTIIYQ